MLKLRTITSLVLFIVFILSILPWCLWMFKEAVAIKLAVIDKTVPQSDYREHLGLFWINDHFKIIKQNGDKYDLEEDYFGYRPAELKGDTNLNLPENLDLIYITDTYGVYSKDLDGNPLGDRSALLYGGLTFFEWNKVMTAKGKDTTLIVEFNTIASPTDPLVRETVEQNMGISWTGWIGRHFPKLQSSEVPIWLKENYEKQTGDSWEFKGPGTAFVNESDFVVVLDEKEIKGPVKFEWTDNGSKHYSNASDSLYGYWFDLVTLQAESSVIEANYEVNLNQKGKRKLDDNNIPTEFPAIIHQREKLTYYFAGDFADISTNHQAKWVLPLPFYQLMGLIKKEENFFWRSYIPLMEQIYKDIKKRDKLDMYRWE